MAEKIAVVEQQNWKDVEYRIGKNIHEIKQGKYSNYEINQGK
jgi:hypothetical protein